LDPPVVDLIRKILVVDPLKHLTVAQIKAHLAFRIGLQDGYVLPAPLALPKIHERIEVGDAALATLEILQQTGFPELDDLKAQLASDSPNMAKVFFAMLTQTAELPLIERDGTSHAISVCEEKDKLLCDVNQPQLDRSFLRPGSAGFTGSMCESFNHAARVTIGAYPLATNETIYNLEIQTAELMMLLQAFARSRSFPFLHPDDRTLIVSNPANGSTLRFVGIYLDERRMSLAIQQVQAAEPGEFLALVAQIRDVLRGFVGGQSEDFVDL
jgi:hypothetical protein